MDIKEDYAYSTERNFMEVPGKLTVQDLLAVY